MIAMFQKIISGLSNAFDTSAHYLCNAQYSMIAMFQKIISGLSNAFDTSAHYLLIAELMDMIINFPNLYSTSGRKFRTKTNSFYGLWKDLLLGVLMRFSICTLTFSDLHLYGGRQLT